MSQNFSQLLESIIENNNLNENQATALIKMTMEGELTPAQIAAWLTAIRMKGETPEEIAAFARIMREKAVKVPGLKHPLVDTCGTGGDKSSLINVSTLSAIVAASLGIPVAKHGNRAVSSSSGSADLLEKLGYPLEATPEEISERIIERNFGFFFAPAFHPAMKYAGPVRKELGVRTIFNILGPLANPAQANIHLMGVFKKELMAPMLKSLEILGVDTAMVVHSDDGLDEISPVAKTAYLLLHEGKTFEGEIDPVKAGVREVSLDQLKAASPDKLIQQAESILSGKDKAGASMIALNTAAIKALWEIHHKRTQPDRLIETVGEGYKDILTKIENEGIDYRSIIG